MVSESEVLHNNGNSGYKSFLLGQTHLRSAAGIRLAGSSPFDVALELFSARLKTEEALKSGYVNLESLVQMADVYVQQLLNFYSSQKRVPDSSDLFEKITVFFEEAVEYSAETVKASARARKGSPRIPAEIDYLMSVAEQVVSSGLYPVFPHPYNSRFANSCEALGTALALAGISNSHVDTLLSVKSQ
ncbi:hypothetical protein HYY73_06125 [Candidatus Woesearchaeota archaeon]|nr:hypothetical protein [Candidatus Woesearchaeota archaeon]